ncbi:MAG: ZIP family metal transporter [Gemmatimonadota bacterium]
MSVFALVLIVAAANVAGALVVTQGALGRRTLLGFLVGFGAGFMLAVALLEMLPPALEVTHGLTAVLLGYLGVHLAQHTVVPHFHFGEETHADAMVSPRVGLMAVAGMLPHAFFDGVAIAGGYALAAELGVLIALAVLLHKVPAGAALASIMLASGNDRSRTLAAVAVVAAATVVGALITPASTLLERYGLALAAGVTLYVAASNLIPEAQRQRGWLLPGGVFVGVAAYYLARLVAPF